MAVTLTRGGWAWSRARVRWLSSPCGTICNVHARRARPMGKSIERYLSQQSSGAAWASFERGHPRHAGEATFEPCTVTRGRSMRCRHERSRPHAPKGPQGT